ncbi:MAG: zinc-ribbon and DUF3426 domain-containing protein [Gammaproteobacteria bacterium]|nr:zinc-ribbon and DUF3426 domain-containing protein [Gammaproteobacteria bacterium]
MIIKYTRCPHCRTVFRVHPEELPAAGSMRCGNCLKPFAVGEHLMDELPATPTAAGAWPEAEGDTPEPPIAVEAAPVAPFELAEEPDAAATLPASLAADTEVDGRPRSGWRALMGLLLAALLLGLLGGQAVVFHPGAVAEVAPQLAPLVERLMPLRRELLARGGDEDAVPYRDLTRIELLSRDVRSHPAIADALFARAVMANTAGLPQPFPAIGFTLFDVNGATLASREFRPEEYLGRPPPPVMTPHQPYQFTLSLVAPKLDAVSFEFTFH